MPWTPLPRIAFAIATHPFTASSPADLPLELGDELYIIEQGGSDSQWFRGYLVAPPSLLAGLTSTKGQTLEARVFSGIFPCSCVEVREVLGDDEESDEEENVNGVVLTNGQRKSGSDNRGSLGSLQLKKTATGWKSNNLKVSKKGKRNHLTNGSTPSSSLVARRDPNAPKPPAPVPMLKIGDETPTSASEPLVDEIASCLREWHSTNLHELLLSRQYPLLDKMSGLVHTLDLSRRQFLHNILTTHELGALREKTVWDLVRGNKVFNGEVIVRDPEERGRVLTGEDSAVEITKLQSMMSLLEERPAHAMQENSSLHHLLVDVKAFVGGSNESTTLVFFLASKSPGQVAVTLSESYIVEVPPSGSLTSITQAGQMRTLFTDLAAADIGDLPSTDNELYLVIKVRSTQQIAAGKPGSRGASRDGSEPTRNGEKPTSSSGMKPGRRSLMWGQKSQRMGKNLPTASRLNSLSETTGMSSESRDGQPPSTAGSRGPDSNATKTGTINRLVTRTVGIGALKINSVMKSDEEVEQLVNIWTPADGFGQEKQEGDGWDDVIKDLMESKSGHYEKSRRAERLQIHLRSFNSPDADDLIKVTPTLLSAVSKTAKMGFSGAPTKQRSDIYITITEAFLPRQALLSRPSGSATPISSSLQGSNLQVTLELRRASGERLENCIYSSSNAEPTSAWESTAAERGDAWSQTLRLVVPPAEVPGSHIVMVLADVPIHPFAICYMPLWDQGAFMRDGHHSLLLYRYDENTSSPKGNNQGRGGYLTLGWNSRGKDDVSKDEAVTGPIATLRLQTYLCSTRFSQDKVLLGLLKWKEQPPGDLQELLKRLVFVPEIEVVKLLNDVFDAIFGILVEHAGNDDYEDLVFSALVTVLSIVHDRRFNLGPLVDQYADNKFNYPFATPCLVRSFTRLLAKPSDPDMSRKLRATFKVLKHILKFITHARGQQKEKEVGIGITSTSPGFTRHLRTIFKSLDGLMQNTAPILVGSQTLAVQHFHTWLPELTGLLSTEEILHIAIDFVDSCALVKGKLVLYKLVLIINYSKLELFSHPEQRAALCANTVRWIAPNWGKTNEVSGQWRDQVRLCCSILSTQVENLGPEIPNYIPKIIDSYLAIQGAPKTKKTKLSLLFPMTYPFPSKPISGKGDFDEVLVELSAILSSISTLPAGMQLELGEDGMAALLEDMLHVHLSILQCEAFPANWLSVHIYHHKSTMKTLEYLSTILLDSFLPDPDDAENYNTELWKAFFTTLLKLVGSDALALETFPEQKRRAVWKIAGDVRENGAELMRRTWEAIGWDTSPDERQRYGLMKMGGYQVQYVPALVGPIIELCLSVHEGLRRVAVEVLQTMIVSEWTLTEDLSVIQTEMIDCLDRLFKSKPLTESILQKLFINELLSLFEVLALLPGDPLYAALKDLITTIDEFLDLLVAVHSTDVTGEASHMIHRLRLMEFLRDMQKEEIFIRYVHQLASLQSEQRNPTEAGLALRLHADLYEWDPTKILPPLVDPYFPAQSQFDRKERIYFDIIRYFEEGEAWTSALAAYQELQAQYLQNVYDFLKLARTQRAIATIYETIAKSDKIVPKYFRVGYRGMGFPPSLRDKEFVFEGGILERTSAFTDRMQEQHPNAQIITTGEVEDVEGQFLQISALTPHRDLDHHIFQRTRVPQVVRDYLLSASPQLFAITSKRNTSGPVNQHSAEKIVYQTLEPFPTILRRSEIVAVERIHLSPIQTALERVIRKTSEMVVVEKRLLEGEEDMAPLLIEALNISVNPNSETSIAHYRDLFPVNFDDEAPEEVELSPLENALKVGLIDHAVMIKRCLGMFAKSNDNAIKARVAREGLAQSTSHPSQFSDYLHSISERHVPFATSKSSGHYRKSHLKLHPSLKVSVDKAISDFESTFASELASFTFPPTHPNRDLSSPTPVPSWRLTSPVPSDQKQSHGLPNSITNGTIATTDTSILDTPSGHNRARSRLSFLKRGGGGSQGGIEKDLILAQISNGNINGGSPAVKEASKSDRRGRARGESGSSRSPSRDMGKENRLSYFGVKKGDDEQEWVTQSDLTSASILSSLGSVHGPSDGRGDGRSEGRGESRRSSSSQRPETAISSGGGSVGSRVGSVRRRLSKLKLGKKSSKATVLMGGVAEEV